MGPGSGEPALSVRKLYPDVGACCYDGPDYVGMASPYNPHAAHDQHDSKGMVILNLVLRIASAVLSLVAVSFIVSAKDEHLYGTSFDDSTFYGTIDGIALRTRANKFLLASAVVIMFYELAQIFLGYLERATQYAKWMSGHVGTLVTFVSDQVLAYLMLAAGAAAANDVTRWRRGDGTASDGVCHGEWSSWCGKVEVGVAMSYLAFTGLAVLALVSGFKFGRLLE